MDTTGFKIYNASAGSGKTYQLTKSYLTLILAPGSKQKYAQLLAITFTNKAVGEMKQRILQSLYDFSLKETPKNSQSLFEEIKSILGLSAEDLQQKAQKTLKELLHNYAYFEVSTIDKFNHKIIRTFARDLKIAQNFEVELDTESLLNQAVAKVLNKAGENKELTDFLINFTLEKIDDNKSWNIAYDLNQIGRILFSENHIPHLKKISKKNLGHFIQLQKLLKLKIIKRQEGIVEKANKNLELISEGGLEYEDFTRKYFPKFMETLSQGNFNVNFNAAWKQNFETAPLYNKSIDNNIKAVIDALQSEFIINFNSLKTDFQVMTFLSKVYKKIVPLTLVNEISKELKAIQEEKNLVNISEFNSIISKEIKDQPVPFIYERLGEKYKHYFIDEFQDTSQMQWTNLVPLIGNALESENEKGEKGSLLLVGDVKQAIYRWRGGQSTQFLRLSQENETPFVVEPNVKNLDTNWRSFSEIIEFNNTFFTFAAPKLENTKYQNLYLEGNKQLKNNKQGGYVEISFLEDDRQEKFHPHCAKILKNIQTVLNKGFKFKDICILVRNNGQGVLVADFLAQNKIPLVSAEALLLKNSSEVNFLISLLNFIEKPQDKEYRFLILEYLSQNAALKHNFIFDNIDELDHFLDTDYGFRVETAKLLTPLDLVEQAISKFNLAPESNAYINYFIDEIFAFGKKESISIFDFLQYWERKQNSLSIAAPEHLDAVNVMTIHKSKGLEFPFVILPFAYDKIDDKLKSNDIWIPVPEEEFCGFEELMVKSSSELENFSEASKKLYLQESNNSQLDDFNVLYVALTRAVNGLFIISSPLGKSAANNKILAYNTLFIDYLKHVDVWQDSMSEYSFGALKANEIGTKTTDKQHIIPYIYTSKDSARFTIATSTEGTIGTEQQEALNIGNILHKALAMVFTKNDIDAAILTLLESGEINQDESEQLNKTIGEIVSHHLLKDYYNQEAKVYNETEILNPDGTFVRPDRMVLKDGHMAIIDYKTGKPNESHKNQLNNYAVVLSKMGYFVSEKILVYTDKTIKPIFV